MPRRKKAPPLPTTVDAVTGELVLPQALNYKVRTNNFGAIRMATARITNAMIRGELDSEFARSCIWALQQCSLLLEKEISHERISKQLDRIEELLSKRPDIREDVIDVNAIRQALEK